MSDELIFLGMTRSPQPPDTKYTKDNGEVGYAELLICPCGCVLKTREGIFAHWQQGHFDTPVYATREEVLAKAAEKVKV